MRTDHDRAVLAMRKLCSAWAEADAALIKLPFEERRAIAWAEMRSPQECPVDPTPVVEALINSSR